MTLPVSITVLVDNTAARPDLHAEHGLSLWIEAGDRRILFDTGQGAVLPHNADRLGLRMRDLDAVAISHGHYDHTGGLPYVLGALAEPAGLYLHPDALESRFVRDGDGSVRSIGMPPASRKAIDAWEGRVVRARGPQEVAPGVWTTGAIPRRCSLEDVGGAYFRDESCTRSDPVEDDSALVLDADPGWVVLLGCAHAGVVNTLTFVAEHFGAARIHAVLGGMHLVRATPERLAATAAAIEERDVRHVVPLHCTGKAAAASLSSRLPGRCTPAGAGLRVAFRR